MPKSHRRPLLPFPSAFCLREFVIQTDRKATGQLGEEIAVRTLREAGLSIVERDWLSPAGELVFVAEEIGPDYASGASDARWLVVVEVRTRSSISHGNARQAFTPRKQSNSARLPPTTCRPRAGLAPGASTQ